MVSNITSTGIGDGTITIDNRPIKEIYVSVQTASIAISLDNGSNFLTLPIGWHRLPVGQLNTIKMKGAGSWQVLVYYD